MAKKCIGIRRETKNIWEKRTPLTPNDVASLIKNENLQFVVQTSPIRAFKDEEYKKIGAQIKEDLSECNLVFAVKELPLQFMQKDKTYVFFSHTIKGQAGNMPILKKIIDLKATLIDYERVTDEKGRRLIFFGEFAGKAGMIDTLWALGQRLYYEGMKTPFLEIKPAHEYENFKAATTALLKVGGEIKTQGIHRSLAPLVLGISGYGNVSRGAQKVLESLPVTQIEPKDIFSLIEENDPNNQTIYKVVFKEEHTVMPKLKDDKFELQDFFKKPEKYRSVFKKYLPYLSILVNCIYWDAKYPRLITKEDAKEMYGEGKTPRLKIVGDISCDIEGGIEFTLKSTDPSQPVFVYDPIKDEAVMGFKGDGPVVLAVDNLPCELPKESSQEFSTVLKKFVPEIAKADFHVGFNELNLPPEIKKAVIVYKGKLTPDYKYLKKHLKNNRRT